MKLSADWRYLTFLNYTVEPDFLRTHVPARTELDSWNGLTHMSLVALLFQNTSIAGVPVPLHQNFEQLNLRFYVRRKVQEEWRHGVVFIREIVPKLVLSSAARLLFNENYLTLPMQHQIQLDPATGGTVVYEWETNKRPNSLHAETSGPIDSISYSSLEHFFSMRPWSYTALPDGGTNEFHVEHPQWRCWPVKNAKLDCDISELYGPEFVNYLSLIPSSAFIAEGSPVTIHPPKRL